MTPNDLFSLLISKKGKYPNIDLERGLSGLWGPTLPIFFGFPPISKNNSLNDLYVNNE